jgi:hypothetical protein
VADRQDLPRQRRRPLPPGTRPPPARCHEAGTVTSSVAARSRACAAGVPPASHTPHHRVCDHGSVAHGPARAPAVPPRAALHGERSALRLGRRLTGAGTAVCAAPHHVHQQTGAPRNAAEGHSHVRAAADRWLRAAADVRVRVQDVLCRQERRRPRYPCVAAALVQRAWRLTRARAPTAEMWRRWSISDFSLPADLRRRGVARGADGSGPLTRACEKSARCSGAGRGAAHVAAVQSAGRTSTRSACSVRSAAHPAALPARSRELTCPGAAGAPLRHAGLATHLGLCRQRSQAALQDRRVSTPCAQRRTAHDSPICAERQPDPCVCVCV